MDILPDELIVYTLDEVDLASIWALGLVNASASSSSRTCTNASPSIMDVQNSSCALLRHHPSSALWSNISPGMRRPTVNSLSFVASHRAEKHAMHSDAFATIIKTLQLHFLVAIKSLWLSASIHILQQLCCVRHNSKSLAL